MSEKETLMHFPCEFPIKIIGNNKEELKEAIAEIASRHFVTFSPETIVFNNSAQGNYISTTLTVLAENQEMLDAFYQEITKHPEIKMVL